MKKSTDKNRFTMIHYIPIFCLFSLIISGIAFAGERNRVLILNSNMATEKYSLIHKEFTSSISEEIAELDLGGKEIDTTEIGERIDTINPDIIFCIGSRAYLSAFQTAGDRAIIFSSAINWKRLPMRKNTYGVSSELNSGMELMMYHYFFPDLGRIGVIYSLKHNKEWLKEAIDNGRDLGLTISGRPVTKPEELPKVLVEFLPEVDVLWLVSDPVVISSKESVMEIFRRADSLKKPIYAYSKIFADLGALLVISADVPTMGVQAAGLVHDLLTNNEIPENVVTPAGSHIILNMKKVKEYGIDLNEEAMDSVNWMIQ